MEKEAKKENHIRTQYCKKLKPYASPKCESLFVSDVNGKSFVSTSETTPTSTVGPS
ncbi:MAG: hypothetical protein ABIA04_10390 [Pseudomonadota bacterium]